MMGPSHALSGAAAWLVGSAIAHQVANYNPTPVTLAVGTVMCAGGALLPDLDMSGRVTTKEGGATVAHTFGRLSMFVAEVLEKLSLGIYDLTRKRNDPQRHNGHRTFTHTLPFNILVGFGAFELCDRLGKWAVLGVLFFTFAMALRGLFSRWAQKAGWIIVTLTAAVGAVGAYWRLDPNGDYTVLGLALGVGGLIHLIGDMITPHGCPVLWPIPLHRMRWRNIGLPDAVAVQVGGKVEVFVLRTMFVLIALVAAGWLALLPVLQRYDMLP
jgi:membrane-bound metal-dependent hydrolase YbcI (DUF457 family)